MNDQRDEHGEDESLVPYDETRDGPTPERGRSIIPLDARRGDLVAAGVLGVVTALIVVFVLVGLTDDDRGSGSASGPDQAQPSTLSATSGTAASAHVPTRLTRCVRAQKVLEDPLRSAGPALDQWAVHVGAMNKLVVGEITLQQAMAFWSQTRVGAQRRVGDFRDAVEALRRQGVDCPDPTLLAPGAAALPACAREVQADVRTLQAAQVSVDTWEEHIHHMDMLRLGTMTPEEATRLWLDSWQDGVRELDDYESAARAAEGADGCSSRGSER